jgi:hypothetical protein
MQPIAQARAHDEPSCSCGGEVSAHLAQKGNELTGVFRLGDDEPEARQGEAEAKGGDEDRQADEDMIGACERNSASLTRFGTVGHAPMATTAPRMVPKHRATRLKLS